MNLYYYSLFFSFTVILCIILIDPNVGMYLYRLFKHIPVNIQRYWHMFLLHPENPLNNWKFKTNPNKILKEIKKQSKKNV